MDTLMVEGTETGRRHAYAAWSSELDDMRQVMADAAAAMDVDVQLVDIETRETVRVFVEARKAADRASVLVVGGTVCGRGSGAGVKR